MTRGQVSAVGTEKVAQNGYVYVKTEDRGWVLKHWLVAEKELGRPVDPKEERVIFVDGNRENYEPNNVKVVLRKTPPDDRRIRTRLIRTEKRVQEARRLLEQAEQEVAGMWEELANGEADLT